MRAAIYARVSTADQQTLQMQIKALREYVARRGWQIIMEVEEISSGAGKRKKRQTIIDAAKRVNIDVIVVWKLDRWSRSLSGLITELHDFIELGVSFVSITEALDLSTPSGKAMAGMLAVFAEFERDMISERVKAGIAHARSKGKKHGRPKTASLQSDKVIELFKQGNNNSQIARKLKISRTSVRRILDENKNI